MWLCLAPLKVTRSSVSPLPSLQEENSVFIMTNMVITMNQTQGLCPEVGSFLEKSLGPHTPLSILVPQ